MKKQYNNSDIKKLATTEWFNQFDKDQQEEILKGIEKELDVSFYANPVFNWEQMDEIRDGLESDVDVSIYAKKEFDWKQMQIIFLGLKDNLDVSSYANEKISAKQMGEIRGQLLREKYFLI